MNNQNHTSAVNPMNSFGDTIVRMIIASFVPLPVVRELLIAFKKPLFIMAVSAILTTLASLWLFLSVLFVPGVGSVGDLIALLPGAGEAVLSEEQIETLQKFVAAGFSDTDIPRIDPFGGSFVVTASFHDLGYYSHFGLIHTGIDLVPAQEYHVNEAYQETGQIIVFSTMNGTAMSYTDSYGALTVDVINPQGTHKTVYKHLKQIISGGGTVRAGQPIGVMGSTGFSTGEHLHYEVQVNQGGRWTAVNPAGYFN